MRYSSPASGLLILLASLVCPAAAETTADPIGEIRQTASFGGVDTVMTGRDASGRPVCLSREEGDSHRLDIGIVADSDVLRAFARLDTQVPREATAREPVRVYAGLQKVQGGYATNRFVVLQSFEGTAHFVARPHDRAGFTVIADGDPSAFLDVVAAARRNFLVVESRRTSMGREFIGVYQFDRAAGQALIACAQRHVQHSRREP